MWAASHPLKVDVRVIAISNRDLRREVQARRFRQDLFYRLNVVSLQPAAAARAAGRHPDAQPTFLAEVRRGLRRAGRRRSRRRRWPAPRLPWPGNIRELENAIQGACIFASEREIERRPHAARGESAALSAERADRDRAEKELILATLRRLNGNRTHAAQALGVSVRTIRNRLREYRLTRRSAYR